MGGQGVFLIFSVPNVFSLCFQNVLIKFPSVVPQVLNLLPKTFQMTPHNISHIFCPWFNFLSI